MLNKTNNDKNCEPNLEYLDVFSLNIRSLVKHFDELQITLHNLKSFPAVLLLTETWLSEQNDPELFRLEQYQSIFTKNRISDFFDPQ